MHAVETANVIEFDSESDTGPLRDGSGQRELPKPVAQSKGKRILVVDDQHAWLEIGRRILSACGYQVQVCDDPHEALSFLEQNPGHLDLVITDLYMPSLDGLALAAQLLKMNAALPVVLTSSAVVELTPSELQRAGIRGFLPKPWQPEQLYSTIHQAIGKPTQ